MSKKILILGFSVTEDGKGFAQVAKKLLSTTNPEIEVHVRGIGGITPQLLSVLFEQFDKNDGSFTHVLLEIATSVYGKRQFESIERDVLDVIYDLLHKIQLSGAQISLVNLYRSDFNYSYHYFDMILESICNRYKLPLLDLANGLLVEKGSESLAPFLRDVVHTTEAGAEFQGREVASFINEVIACNILNKKIPTPRNLIRSLSIVNQSVDFPQYVYKRSGMELIGVSIAEGENLAISIPDGYSFCGISFLSGPLSGNLGLKFDGAEKETIIATYDEFCYYDRFAFRWFNGFVKCKSIVIRQLPGMPSVQLKKGSADNGARLGRLFEVYIVAQGQEVEKS